VVHCPCAILSGRTTNSLLCLSGGIFFDRTSVAVLKKMLPRLRTGRQHDKERCCPWEWYMACVPFFLE